MSVLTCETCQYFERQNDTITCSYWKTTCTVRLGSVMGTNGTNAKLSLHACNHYKDSNNRPSCSSCHYYSYPKGESHPRCTHEIQCMTVIHLSNLPYTDLPCTYYIYYKEAPEVLPSSRRLLMLF